MEYPISSLHFQSVSLLVRCVSGRQLDVSCFSADSASVHLHSRLLLVSNELVLTFFQKYFYGLLWISFVPLLGGFLPIVSVKCMDGNVVQNMRCLNHYYCFL